MKILIGDIFDSGAQTIVNTVNCVGIMGKGIAAEFKKRFPEMLNDYISRCNHKEVKPGIPYLFKESFFFQIINFPTKSHWRAASCIEDIEKGLKIIAQNYKKWGVESIAVPPLGCGNGQLLWEAVGPLLYRYLSKLDIPVTIYAPYGTSSLQLSEKFLSTGYNGKKTGSGEHILRKLNPAWVSLVEIVSRIEKETYHMPVGRTIFQKIAYVATTQGLPTGLEYQRSSYGPYCRNLDEVKKRLSNNSLLKEQRLGQMFQVMPGLAYEKNRNKYKKDFQRWNNIIDKTVDLFLRLNTRKAEIVATVLFTERTLNKENNMTEQNILEGVMKWKQKRRPPLNEKSVAEVIRNLGMLKWVNLKFSKELQVDDN